MLCHACKTDTATMLAELLGWQDRLPSETVKRGPSSQHRVVGTSSPRHAGWKSVHISKKLGGNRGTKKLQWSSKRFQPARLWGRYNAPAPQAPPCLLVHAHLPPHKVSMPNSCPLIELHSSLFYMPSRQGSQLSKSGIALQPASMQPTAQPRSCMPCGMCTLPLPAACSRIPRLHSSTAGKTARLHIQDDRQVAGGAYSRMSTTHTVRLAKHAATLSPASFHDTS